MLQYLFCLFITPKWFSYIQASRPKEQSTLITKWGESILEEISSPPASSLEWPLSGYRGKSFATTTSPDTRWKGSILPRVGWWMIKWPSRDTSLMWPYPWLLVDGSDYLALLWPGMTFHIGEGQPLAIVKSSPLFHPSRQTAFIQFSCSLDTHGVWHLNSNNA